MQMSASSPVENEVAMCRCRKIVPVDHDLKRDVKAMKSVGFVVEEMAPIIAYLDTQKIVDQLYGCKYLSVRIC